MVGILCSVFEGMGSMLEAPEDLARIVQSQVETWAAEVVVLRRDPSVKKFLKLQDQIDQTDAFMVEGAMPPPSEWLWPYDLYDAFEFARDLAGRQIPAQVLSRLAHGRFPNMSSADRQIMMRFLTENGIAEVARTPDTGRPASYRFAPLGNGRTGGNGRRLGLPGNELSGLKAEDLEDVVGPPWEERERSSSSAECDGVL